MSQAGRILVRPGSVAFDRTGPYGKKSGVGADPRSILCL